MNINKSVVIVMERAMGGDGRGTKGINGGRKNKINTIMF